MRIRTIDRRNRHISIPDSKLTDTEYKTTLSTMLHGDNRLKNFKTRNQELCNVTLKI